jgi:acylphosphatase
VEFALDSLGERIVSDAEPPVESLRVERPLERREVLFAGRVQGVGFRYTVRSIAARYDVRGFVKNLNDGRVMLVVEGARSSLDSFIAAVQAEMERHIADQQTTILPITGEFSNFEIRH